MPFFTVHLIVILLVYIKTTTTTQRALISLAAVPPRLARRDRPQNGNDITRLRLQHRPRRGQRPRQLAQRIAVHLFTALAARPCGGRGVRTAPKPHASRQDVVVRFGIPPRRGPVAASRLSSGSSSSRNRHAPASEEVVVASPPRCSKRGSGREGERARVRRGLEGVVGLLSRGEGIPRTGVTRGRSEGSTATAVANHNHHTQTITSSPVHDDPRRRRRCASRPPERRAPRR